MEEAYDALLENLLAHGSVLHATITTEVIEGDERQQPLTNDIWVDAERHAGREEFVLSPDYGAELPDDGAAVFDDRYVYYPDDPGEGLRQEVEVRCPGADNLLISVLLECASFSLHSIDEDATVSLEQGVEYEGTPAIALVFRGDFEDGPAFTSSVYLDAGTLLPIARITRTSSDDAEVETISRYGLEFVSRDSLDGDFLDPRSIGYGIEDASEQIDRIESEVPVYWLGEDIDLAGDDDLVLAGIETKLMYPPDEAPYAGGRSYGRHLYYETPTGVPGVYIFLWTPAEWERYLATPQGQFLSNELCAPSAPVSAVGTTGVLYDLVPHVAPIEVDNPTTDQERCEKQEHELWMIPYDRIAVLEFEDVVVDVRSDVVGYFDEPEPFAAVLAALRRP
ncbi:MAG: hypothetical protein WEE64_05260 [Dehalococcoidia bacterium]